MKNRLSKVVVSTLLITSSLLAEEPVISYEYENTYSFIGLEGGMSTLDIEGSNGTDPAMIKDHDLYHGGLKVGAQSDNYKIYFNVNYYDVDSDFDHLVTYGVGLQYMFTFTEVINPFIGINAGMANGKFYVEGEPTSRTISDPYIGAELGANMHLGDDVDLEIGVRLLSMDASNIKNDIRYTFDNMITGYASINFRYRMD